MAHDTESCMGKPLQLCGNKIPMKTKELAIEIQIENLWSQKCVQV